MLSNLQAWTVVGIVGIIWLALSIVGTVNGGPAAILALSDTIPLLLIVASAFERWAWRWQRIHPLLVGMPVVLGTWEGELESLWEDPHTHKHPPIKTVYLAIGQTLTTVSVRLLTDESASGQMAGIIAKQASGVRAISYTYENTPFLGLRKASPSHRGGAFLTIFGEPPNRIEGEYWTSRDSKGMLRMRRRVRTVAESFEEAQALFGKDSAQTPAS